MLTSQTDLNSITHCSRPVKINIENRNLFKLFVAVQLNLSLIDTLCLCDVRRLTIFHLKIPHDTQNLARKTSLLMFYRKQKK